MADDQRQTAQHGAAIRRRRPAQRCAPGRTDRAGACSSAPIDPGSQDRCRARGEGLPLMTTPDFMVIAHRGASSYAPENTLAAFDLAIEMGVSHIELDVHTTRDGHVVVIHDDTADRTTNGSGPVTSHSLAELTALDAGAWFDRRFVGQRIPTLSAVLERYKGRAHIHTEIKGHSADLSRATVDLVRRHGMVEQVTITSFQKIRLEETRAHAPELPTGWLVADVSDATI